MDDKSFNPTEQGDAGAPHDRQLPSSPSLNEDHRVAVERVIEYMKKHMEEPVTTAQLAAHAGYSPYHFTRVFKAVTGISVRQYLSALRIEAGKIRILQEQSLMVKVLRRIGFSSIGSFQTRFKDYVGLPPKKFRSLSRTLHGYVNQYEDIPLSFPEQGDAEALPRIRCRIEAPPSFRGIIFVGLFPRPIPDRRPAAGSALNMQNRTCTFSDVPHGTYYLLAAGIPWSLNPKDYYLLDKTLRAKHDKPIQVDSGTDLQFSLTLREPLPFDPPIVINLPLLLFEKKNRK
ncbi:helix-turn-helix domain-containing protein [Paenibacillus sp. DMB20]|uniref:helix-turn-helix domain-containing protein n=1 Tax=Paenibacillus sp. DMB20 TaxID=1642570 RepID=UPI0009E27709|nr:AraC family transcriptional regulator [Paenibacillus sp. DMB20]